MFKTRLGGDYWAVLKLFVYFVLPIGVSLAVISEWFKLTPKFWFTLMATMFIIFITVPFTLAILNDAGVL